MSKVSPMYVKVCPECGTRVLLNAEKHAHRDKWCPKCRAVISIGDGKYDPWWEKAKDIAREIRYKYFKRQRPVDPEVERMLLQAQHQFARTAAVLGLLTRMRMQGRVKSDR